MTYNTNEEDLNLVKAIQSGNRAAFRQLYDRYYKYLVVTAYNVLGDSEKARDLAQDVFFTLWTKKDQLNINSAVKSYLRRAVINRTLNFIESQRLNFDEDDPVFNSLNEEASAQKELEGDELQRIVNQTIDKLPQKCRMIFKLCRIEKIPHKEVAEQLGISTKTIENQMTKALKILKSAIQPYVNRPLSWLSGFLSVFHQLF